MDARHDRGHDFAPAAIQQWEWEEALNSLRRRAPQNEFESHWATTGQPTIDARARTHIGEWLALDSGRADRRGQPDAGDHAMPTIIEALVGRALSDRPWQLYVVDSSDSQGLNVRRLRDQRGHQIRWWEGRQQLAPQQVVALRVGHLDPPGIDVATLPVQFGPRGADALIMALLRAFGAHESSDWTAFMADLGARIILEYGLAHLEEEARKELRHKNSQQSQRRAATMAFARLERTLAKRQDQIPRRLNLASGHVAWINEIDAGLELMIFANEAQRQRFLTASPMGLASNQGWLRAYRAAPDHLSFVEQAIMNQGTIDHDDESCPERPIRLECFRATGQRDDPDRCELALITAACQHFMASAVGQAA